MNDGNQAVAILADIEDDISLYIIGVVENLTDFHEVPPPRGLRDFSPCRNFFGGIWVLLHRPVHILFSDDVHAGSSAVRQEPLPPIGYFSKCKGSRRTFHFEKNLFKLIPRKARRSLGGHAPDPAKYFSGSRGSSQSPHAGFSLHVDCAGRTRDGPWCAH